MTSIRRKIFSSHRVLLGVLAVVALVAVACREETTTDDTVLQLTPAESSAVDVLAQADLQPAQDAQDAQDAQAARDAEEALKAEAEQSRLENEAAANANLEEQEELLALREELLQREKALQDEQSRVADRRSALLEHERRLDAAERDLESQRAAAAERERYEAERTQDRGPSDDSESGTELFPSEGGSTPTEATQVKEPEPSPVELTLQPGRLIEIEVLETLTSRTSRVGDTFEARLVQDLRDEDGNLVIGSGAEVVGKVTHVTPLKTVGGQAELDVEFTHIVLPSGEPIAIRASFVQLGANKRKDKKKIAGAAIVGAILGRVLGDGSDGALAGAAVGAAAGTAVVARAKGKDAEIPAGESVALQLEEVVTVTVEMTGPAEG